MEVGCQCRTAALAWAVEGTGTTPPKPSFSSACAPARAGGPGHWQRGRVPLIDALQGVMESKLLNWRWILHSRSTMLQDALAVARVTSPDLPSLLQLGHDNRHRENPIPARKTRILRARGMPRTLRCLPPWRRICVVYSRATMSIAVHR